MNMGKWILRTVPVLLILAGLSSPAWSSASRKNAIEALGAPSVNNTADLAINGSVTDTYGDPASIVAGIKADDTVGSVDNSGDINASTSHVDLVTVGDDTLTLFTPEAMGIDVNNTGGSLTNTGTLLVFAGGPTNQTASSIGILASYTNGSILNTGDITAEAQGSSNAYASGIHAQATGGGILNSGNISASTTSTGNSYTDGIWAVDLGGDLTNSGNITAEAEGTNLAEARGIILNGSNGDVLNSGDISALATSNASATARAIYALSVNGSLTSNGTTTATSQSLTSGSARADGITAYSVLGSVLNAGPVTVNATAASGNAQAYGLDINSAASVTNTGTLSVYALSAASSSAQAWGIYADDIDGDVINSGDITVSASGSSSQAYGIRAYEITGNLLNSGSILARGNSMGSEVYGLYAYASAGNLTNSGTIAASSATTGSNSVYGIYANALPTGIITSSGSVTAESTSQDTSRAYGLWAQNTDSILNSGNLTATGTGESAVYTYALLATQTGAITNTGAIVAAATGNGTTSPADAFGIDADETYGDITNNGTITASAITTGSGEADAEGIDADDSGQVANSGTVTAVSHAATALAEATGIDTDVSTGIDNTGDIMAAAYSSGNAKAWGLDAELTEADIVNTGTINVAAYASTSSNQYRAEAWGIFSTNANGNIRNDNQIITTGLGHGAYTYAIFAQNTGGDIVNTGNLTSSALSVDSGQARGIYGWHTDGDIINSGDITAMGIGAYDVYPVVGIEAETTGGNIINTGTIAVTGTVGTDEDAYAEAIGVDASRTTGFFQNDGDISVAVSAGGERYVTAWGLDIQYISDTIGNAGDIIVTATDMGEGALANAYGMAVGVAEDIRNSGTVSAAAMAHESAYAYGLDATGTGEIDNNGTITASATAEGSDNAQATAFGVRAFNTDGDIVNSGDITATAHAHTSYASGIEATLIEGDIVNSGSITAQAMSQISGAHGIKASAMDGDIINTGDITAYAQSDVSMAAYGIYAGGNTDFAAPGALTNTGTITVHGDSGAGIHIAEGYWNLSNPGFVYTSAGTRTLSVTGMSGATLADSFRIIFNGDPTAVDYLEPIYVGSGPSLDLNEQALIAQAGDSVVFNSAYQVIEKADPDSSYVLSTFDGLENPNPNITAAWAGADNGENAAVIFSYTPQTTNPAAGMRLANFGVMEGSNLIQQRSFSQLLAKHVREQEATLVADSGQTASDSGFLVAGGANSDQAVFIRPYLKTINRREEQGMGFDGSLLGIIAGYERDVAADLTLGLHAGLGVGNVSYTGTYYDSNEDDQQLYSLGLHGAYNPGNWHVDGSATVYAAQHDYDGKTGPAMTTDETDEYTSYGAEAEVVGGYVLSQGRFALMPFAGLGYSWLHAPSHTTDAEDSAWDTKYSSVDEHIVRSILGAQVSGNWNAGATTIVPSLGVRWEYTLTDNDISVSQSLLNSDSVEVSDEVGRSSVIADGSVVFSRDAASLELGAMAQFNEDFNSQGGWLALKWAF